MALKSKRRKLIIKLIQENDVVSYDKEINN